MPHPAYAVTHLHAIGLSARTAATNLRGRRVSEADVKRAHESDAYRDFHHLTYVEYAYLQWGVITTAQHTVDIIAAYKSLPDRTTAPDTPELHSRLSHFKRCPIE